MPVLNMDLKLPDALYNHALTLDAQKRQEYLSRAAAAALADDMPIVDDADDDWQNEPIPPDHMAAIARGVADADAGRVRPMSDFFAELEMERITRLGKLG